MGQALEGSQMNWGHHCPNVQEDTSENMCVEAGGGGGDSSVTFHFICQGRSLLKSKLIDLACLAGQLAPGFGILSLSPKLWDDRWAITPA